MPHILSFFPLSSVDQASIALTLYNLPHFSSIFVVKKIYKMQFLHAVGLVASLASSVSALPQGDYNNWWQPPTTTVAVDIPVQPTLPPILPPSATAVPSAAPSAVPSGAPSDYGVTIVNNLDDCPIYLSSVSNEDGPMQTLNKGDKFSESWRINPAPGAGISIKMGPSQSDRTNVLQFEYTLKQEEEGVYWDMSSINLLKVDQIVAQGFKVTSSDGSCEVVECKPGDRDCAASYQHPDDVNTRFCPSKSSFILTLGNK